MIGFISKKRRYILFIAFAFLGVILVSNGGYVYAVKRGLNTWVGAVLPTVFPYAFVTAILCRLEVADKLCAKLGKITKCLFNTGGATAFAFFVSLIGGYPLGAKTVAELKEEGLLSQTEAQRATSFCSTTSPVYMITAVGTIAFNNKLFGVLLFISNLLASIIVGVIFSFYKRDIKPSPLQTTSNRCNNVFYEGVFTAITSTLLVGAVIVLFTVLCEILLSAKLLDLPIFLLGKVFNDQMLAKGTIIGLIECSLGIKEISALGLGKWSLALCGVLCGFGGCSAIIQSIGYIKKAKIKTAPFIFAKILHAVINFFICLLFNFIFF